MSSTLAQSKCFQHPVREAVARCPDCSKFFCHECVTEHDGRMICRTCLDDLLEEEVQEKSGVMQAITQVAMACIGFLITASLFYLLGRFLLNIPSQFHSGGFFD